MSELQTMICLSVMVRDSKKKPQTESKKAVNSSSVKPVQKVRAGSSPKANDVTFDFSYSEWLRTIKLGEFTNKLRGPHEFAKLIYIVMNKIVPYITENWHWIEKTIYPGSVHNCHPVSEEKLDKVKEVIKNTHTIDLEPMIETGESKVLWQLGHQGSVRIIVYYMASSKTFYPLFVDYHHLIHPVHGDRRSQVKHNDYKNKDWCPVESYK